MSSAGPQPARPQGRSPQPTGVLEGSAADSPAVARPTPSDPTEAIPPDRLDTQTPYGRLVALGVVPSTARTLLTQYGSGRIVDALDAVDTLADGEVRRRAGWVVAAIREGWDLGELLAERRAAEARYARWERERTERDCDAAGWHDRESVAGSWRGAISAALDDRQLEVAVERVTTPVAGLDRRSVPVVAAQLLAWAVTAHRHAPDCPLSEVLAADLARPDRRPAPTSLDGPLPPGPAVAGEPDDDLTERLTRLLTRRPDLARPGVPNRERAGEGRGRAVGEGVGHGR